jgi:hypothetical protein
VLEGSNVRFGSTTDLDYPKNEDRFALIKVVGLLGGS